MQPNILIVEDESALVELLTYNLQKAGFRTAVARDADATRSRGLREAGHAQLAHARARAGAAATGVTF